MEDRINEAMRDLERSLRTISSLLSWRRLQLSEQRPHMPPSFEIYDSTEDEIRAEVWFFFKIALDINDLLAEIPMPARERICRRLGNLQARLNRLFQKEPKTY